MTTKNKNTAPEAATSETAKSFDIGSVTTAYLNKRGQNTGRAFGTWAGALPAQDDHVALIVPLSAVIDMIHEGPQLMAINPGCVEAQARAARAAEEKREAEKRRLEENRRRCEEEENIHRLIDAHRGGDTTAVAKVLDALVAEDDQVLASLGLTSWSDFDEEDDQ